MKMDHNPSKSLDPASLAGGDGASWNLFSRRTAGKIALIIPLGLAVALAATIPGFATMANLVEVLRQSAVLGVIAIGVTFVVIAGRLDLSVGSLLSLCAVIAVEAHDHYGPAAAIGCALAAGMATGWCNGFLVARLRLNSLVATLGMMSLLQGVLLVQMNGQNAFINAPDTGWFSILGRGLVLGVPVPVIILACLALAAHFLLSRTVWGRKIYAVGGNETASAYSGINTKAVIWSAYVLAGGLTGLAAVIFASRVMAAQPDSGNDFEIFVMAGIILGGTSLLGGSGGIGRSIAGILMLALIQNALLLLGLPYYVQWIVTWAIIIGAVWADVASKRGSLLVQ